MSPGEFDNEILNRYQETLVQRGPQPRPSGPLGLLEPAEKINEPRLRVVPGPDGQSIIYISLDEAIMRALANSLDIQVISYDPAVAYEQAVQAAAAFDAIVFGSAGYTKNVQPGLATPFFPAQDSVSKNAQYQVGLRQLLPTGGAYQIAPTLTRNLSNPRTWNPSLNLEFDQPLLRNAWPEYTLSTLRLAQLNVELTQAQFRQRVEETINSVINSYWTLVQARRDYEIQVELLGRTVETYDRVKERIRIDATYAELKQAESAVETARAQVFRAAKNVRDAQDSLARQLADKQINILTRYDIIPSTSPTNVPLHIDGTDQLVLALGNNPLLEQARLAISASDINVRVAENQTLPKLDFQSTATISGIDSEFGESVDDASSLDHIGYSVNLLFEYPLGNRAALAELSLQKYNRLKAIVTLQNTADQIATQINERIRQVQTTFKEMQAQRSAILASAAQLDALQSQEEIRGRLSPEFLQVKLQAQRELAQAQRAELQAIVFYNQAITDIARLTGTILDQHGINLRKMPVAAGEVPWPLDQGPWSPATLPAVPTKTPVEQEYQPEQSEPATATTPVYTEETPGTLD